MPLDPRCRAAEQRMQSIELSSCWEGTRDPRHDIVDRKRTASAGDYQSVRFTVAHRRFWASTLAHLVLEPALALPSPSLASTIPTFTMTLNTLLMQRASMLPTVSRRAFTTAARVHNAQPQLIREGPAAPKNNKERFDDGRDDAHYPGVQQKIKAFNETYPNRPNASRPSPEPESPGGHEGAFADHRGRGERTEHEQLKGSEEAAETRTHKRVGQIARNAAQSLFGSKSFSTYAALSAQPPAAPSRTSSAASEKGSVSDHPGYTTADAPIDSRPPSEMPKPAEGAMPSSSVSNASTKAASPHPEVHTMAKGAQTSGAGQDAIHPEDRSQSTWGANARSAQFNPDEGKRQPLHHGGSHEGGFEDNGKSRT